MSSSPPRWESFPDLDAPDTLELLGRNPDRAAALSLSQIAAALGRANRRDSAARARQIQAVLCAPQLRQPSPVQGAYAAIVTGQVALIGALNAQIEELGEVVGGYFGQHRDAEIYLSQPGLGIMLRSRILAEFGGDQARFTSPKGRKNYAGTSPITRASGTRKVVLARYARNRRLADALHQWAFCAMRGSSGARAYYQALRGRGIGHQAALRQLSKRLVGILHGCLKTRTPYNEHTAWNQQQQSAASQPERGMSAATRALISSSCDSRPYPRCVTHEAAEGVIERLILALAAQLDTPAHSALTPGAAEALTRLSRAEADLIFGVAGHLVHYGADTEPLELLIRLISDIQRGEAPADAAILPGDVVRLVSEPPASLAAYDPTRLRDTAFIVRYVGDDATVDVQPELIDDYVIETVPIAIVRPTHTPNPP